MHRFEALFNHASMGIVMANSSGTIQSVNPFALKLFGYTVDEIIGKPVETLIPNRYHHNHKHNRETYANNPKSRPMGVGMDLFAVKKDSTEFPVEVSLGNYITEGEQNLIAFISDISVRKKAEAEIEKLNSELEMTIEQRTRDLTETLRQLEISRDRLEGVLSYQNALFENAGVMLMATDETGVIRLFNPESATNMGYVELEVINKMNIISFHDAKEIAVKRRELFNEYQIHVKNNFNVIVEKSKRNIHEEVQYTYIKNNGSTFPASVTITVIKDGMGKITGFMVIAIDISERKRAEAELRSALEKEKELNELKSRFVSMASHEFRTPLSTVLSSTYLIEKYTATGEQPKREKHLNRIISSVNMLTDILNDFLSVGKIEEGKIQVKRTLFSIQELVSETTDEMRINLKPHRIIVYNHSGSTEVLMDASMLKHIIMNLVSNAGKFSPYHNPIEIKTDCYDQQVIVSVKDLGIGISKDDQKHLMERFFRGANAENIQGTGLGLHIVSKYAELMNGKVVCKSELEKGTEFIITFDLNSTDHEKNISY